MVQIPICAVTAVGLWSSVLRLEANAFSTGGAAAFKVPRGISMIKKKSSAMIAFLPSHSTLSSTRLYSEKTVKSTIVRRPDSSVELTLKVPGTSTQAAYDRACAEITKKITIPGFRKGAKIPPAVLENAVVSRGMGRYALRAQAINNVIGQLLEPAIKNEHQLEPIGQPALVTPAEILAKTFVPGQPIDIMVRCDVWPDIQWKQTTSSHDDKPYVGLVATYKRPPFNQAKLDVAVADLRERYASTKPMDDIGRPLQMGDACLVNMEGFMANGMTKAEPLPNAASGDSVQIVLGPGRYMEGLVEGLVGAKVGETKTIYVTFPKNLRDKTLAGKKAIFDVSILEASTRFVPEITDEFANNVRPGLTADSLMAELRKAVDDNASGEWMEARNNALAKALANVMDVPVPDTLVTNQAREKYTIMMADFREQGMADEEIKKLITPENFLKYKEIEKPDIVRDFKVSMATDEIARLEEIEVPAYQIEEQLANLKKEYADEEYEEAKLRTKVESTIMRRMVFDFLAEHANLTVEYQEEGKFDEELMEQLARESLAREKTAAEAATTTTELQISDSVVIVDESMVDPEATSSAKNTVSAADESMVEPEASSVAESTFSAVTAMADDQGIVVAPAEEDAKKSQPEEDEEARNARYGAMSDEERAFSILMDLGLIQKSPDPDSPDYDSTMDDDIASENTYL